MNLIKVLSLVSFCLSDKTAVGSCLIDVRNENVFVDTEMPHRLFKRDFKIISSPKAIETFDSFECGAIRYLNLMKVRELIKLEFKKHSLKPESLAHLNSEEARAILYNCMRDVCDGFLAFLEDNNHGVLDTEVSRAFFIQILYSYLYEENIIPGGVNVHREKMGSISAIPVLEGTRVISLKRKLENEQLSLIENNSRREDCNDSICSDDMSETSIMSLVNRDGLEIAVDLGGLESSQLESAKNILQCFCDDCIDANVMVKYLIDILGITLGTKLVRFLEDNHFIESTSTNEEEEE